LAMSILCVTFKALPKEKDRDDELAQHDDKGIRLF
jgi:hypothetical protein